jgi:hypothetical protein
MQALPPELQLHVLSYLSPPDLACIARVSRAYAQLVAAPETWRALFARRFAAADGAEGASGGCVALRRLEGAWREEVVRREERER